jgi:coenzyme PQQ precursor peptide PqqA
MFAFLMRRSAMTWSKPDFVEIVLGMEATAYVNTDEKAVISAVASEERPAAPALTTDH